VKRGTRHPIHTFLEAGVPVAHCCDNSTFSATDQNREGQRAADLLGFETVEKIHAQAEGFSFIRPETHLHHA
jgi:adenosine deaminase